VDEAIYQMNQSPSYTGENTTLGGGTFSVSVSTSGSNKLITATGYVPNSTSPLASRTVVIQAGENTSAGSFNYGVQAGAGGFILSGGASIAGNVYADGSINATTGVHISGSAIAANPPAAYVDQSNGTTTISSCTSSSCITFDNTSATGDVAQSFVLGASGVPNSVAVYLEKIGSPHDITLRIVSDSSGAPGNTTLLSATLPAASIGTSLGWATTTLPSTPLLSAGQTYWIVLDTSSPSSSKYYQIGATSGGYSGVAEVGAYGGSWSATSPAGLESYFSVTMGTGGTSIIGSASAGSVGAVYTGSSASDITWAHQVQGASVTGSLYCVTGSYNSKSCTATSSDPNWAPLPLLDSDIASWENDATSGGVISGNYTVGSSGATLGPTEITGNLLVNGGGTLTVTGTLYIQGSFTVTGGGKVVLSPSYGGSSGIIVADGPIAIGGGSSLAGSGTTGSYPFLVTTSACPAGSGCAGVNAIELSGGGGAVALIAQNGTADIAGGTAVKMVTAQTISMEGGATLSYDSGLASAFFSSGPSGGGGWAFIPGTYAIAP
ncbi:MAG: choice-of-anchor R domain-containing protein, partial [Minisyncoccia bacterium]